MRLRAFVLLSVITLQAQESLPRFLAEGKVQGHVRNYFMTTDNHGLSNYYANATGGLISYTRNEFKGLELGVSGLFNFKTFGDNMNAVDPVTGKSSKWERELFDLSDPVNYYNLYRLEALYLKYRYKQSYISVGRLPLEYHPLINNSDGRMQDFAFQGINSVVAIDSSLSVNFTVLNRVSPRAVPKWYSPNEAIGLLNDGYLSDGTKADYSGLTHANAIAYIGIEKTVVKLKLNFWDTHIDKLLNTIWAEALYSSGLFSAGFQYSYQMPCANQKNVPYANRYVQPGEHGQVASTMVKFKTTRFEAVIAFTAAFNTGRYLFPRELGRDQFYTSMPRSRIEGLGNSNIVRVGLKHTFPAQQLTAGVDATAVNGPGVRNYSLNKYGFDDYHQINSIIHYSFKGFFKGLNVILLYIWKQNKNLHTPADIINVSDYSQINLISNFNF
ncbi:hypothetical protein ACLI09_17200 [Flavobacterium sp. RHBU_24]|uniref:hypothetical protein n=1 Tax=Flavobacterium sp. RHBU_24 TaxID=3391185 RepID=UPI0039847FDD